MKTTVLITFILLFFNNCNNKSKNVNLTNDSEKINTDSLKALSLAIQAYKNDEKSSLDSVKKNNLEFLNEKCKNILYTLYCYDTLIGKNNVENITIGECNIRIIEFKSITPTLKYLGYKIFFNDSIPLIYKFLTQELENVIQGFEIDQAKGIVTKAIEGYYGKIDFEYIEHSYDTIKTGKTYKNYIANYKKRLHPNFKNP